MRRENADEIEVLHVFSADADTIMELERSLHQELSGVQVHHEWFEDCPQVRAAIEDLDRRFNPEHYADFSVTVTGKRLCFPSNSIRTCQLLVTLLERLAIRQDLMDSLTARYGIYRFFIFIKHWHSGLYEPHDFQHAYCYSDGVAVGFYSQVVESAV